MKIFRENEFQFHLAAQLCCRTSAEICGEKGISFESVLFTVHVHMLLRGIFLLDIIPHIGSHET